MFDLANKVALITGATGGIGHGIAKTFCEAGAKVIASGTRQDALDSLEQEFSDYDLKALGCDLSDQDAISKFFDDAHKIFDKIDIVICNAGITRDGLLMKMKYDQWSEVINVNLNAVFLLNQHAVKSMMRQRYGRIINITSVVGTTGNFGQANYAASKGAVTSMTKSIARECASRNITVNCIAPGFIKTPMTDAIPDAIVQEKILPQIPTKNFGEPEDIANAALFLSSNEARYITGQTLHVNGGMLMA